MEKFFSDKNVNKINLFQDKLDQKRSKNGFRFSINNNEKEIGDSLIKLLSDEEKLKKYSENGRKFMEQKIDFSFMKEI